MKIQGKPIPDAEIPTIGISGQIDEYGPPVLLPPPDPRENLAGLTNPCVVTPIARVCIVGKRSPLDADEPPLPTGNPPIFPQWACDFAHVTCTRGQTPTKPGRRPDPKWWPTFTQYDTCMKEAKAHLAYCKTITEYASESEVTQCFNNAIAAIDDCETLYGLPDRN